MNYQKAATKPAAIFHVAGMCLDFGVHYGAGFSRGFGITDLRWRVPAFARTVYLFVWLLPVLLEQNIGVRFHLFRITACLVLATGFWPYVLRSESYYFRKNVSVGDDGDKIMTYSPAVRILFMATLRLRCPG